MCQRLGTELSRTNSLSRGQSINLAGYPNLKLGIHLRQKGPSDGTLLECTYSCGRQFRPFGSRESHPDTDLGPALRKGDRLICGARALDQLAATGPEAWTAAITLDNAGPSASAVVTLTLTTATSSSEFRKARIHICQDTQGISHTE